MSVPDNNESSGGRNPRFTYEDFLDALEQMDGMATTPELSEIVDCSNDTTRRNMKDLNEDPESPVSHRDVGQYSLWLLDNE